jgi:hypothetical protein
MRLWLCGFNGVSKTDYQRGNGFRAGATWKLVNLNGFDLVTFARKKCSRIGDGGVHVRVVIHVMAVAAANVSAARKTEV